MSTPTTGLGGGGGHRPGTLRSGVKLSRRVEHGRRAQGARPGNQDRREGIERIGNIGHQEAHVVETKNE